MNITQLESKTLPELRDIARDMDLSGYTARVAGTCGMPGRAQCADDPGHLRNGVAVGEVVFGPDHRPVTDLRALVDVTDGLIVRAGKRKIARVRRSHGE